MYPSGHNTDEGSGSMPKPSSSDEATEVKWVEVAEAQQFTTDAYAERVTDAFLDAPPKLRAHDGIRIVSIQQA